MALNSLKLDVKDEVPQFYEVAFFSMKRFFVEQTGDQLLQIFSSGVAVLCLLAFLGLTVFANEGALLVPSFISKWAEFFEEQAAEKRAPVFVWWVLCALSYLLLFAISGFMIMVCVALLASPALLFHFVMGWTWEASALPGVITGIVLIVIGLYLLMKKDEENRNHQKEIDSVKRK